MFSVELRAKNDSITSSIGMKKMKTKGDVLRTESKEAH